MNLTQRRFIETWAQEIIVSYYQSTSETPCLPIPILNIAEKEFQIKVDTSLFKGKLTEVSAVALPNQRWILLNSRHNNHRLRFGLAHEILHCLAESDIYTKSHQIKMGFDYLRSSNPRLREMAANYFAGALLMPKTLVMRSIKRNSLDDDNDLSSIAALFDVSESALKLRLVHLKELPYYHSEIEKQLSTVYSNSKIQPSKRTDVDYILVKPPLNVYDNRFVSRMSNLCKKGKPVYYLIDHSWESNLNFLMEFKYGDGFVTINDPKIQFPTKSNSLSAVEIIDLEYLDTYYSSPVPENSENRVSTSLIAYTSDINRKIPNQQLRIAAVSSYIESDKKQYTRSDARKFIRICKKEGRKVVIATGCFDIITDVHVSFFQRAKSAGDVLVVGVENDLRIRAFKNSLRPVNTAEQRLTVLDELKCVDFSFIIHGHTSQSVKPFYTRLYRFLGADLLAVTEGDPYLKDRKEEIESAGGNLVVISRVGDASTTSLLRKFFEETVLSDMVFVRKRLIYEWSRKESGSGQLKLPFPD